MEEILKEKIKKKLQDRKDFWEIKSTHLKTTFSTTKITLKDENSKIFEEITDIDREIKTLEAVIKNSSDLATSIIKPIKEREKCIENMTNTKLLLEDENKLKFLLEKIKHEKENIENKIIILLEANDYIKLNHFVFDNYRELILSESKDVVSYLNKIYDEKTFEISELLKMNFSNPINIKEFNLVLNSLDKNCLLIYKLTLDKKFMEIYFDQLVFFVVKLISRGFIDEFFEKIKKPENLTLENVKFIISSVNSIISKIFLKIASIINERKIIYLKEFNDYNLLYVLITVLFCNMEKYLDNYFILIYQIIEIFNKLNIDNKELDFLCSEISSLIGNFEKFKFFISILQEKINLINTEKNLLSEDIVQYRNKNLIFAKKFNGYLYDLGEKYANCEIKLIKSRLIKIFKEESKNFHLLIDSNLNCNYDEFSIGIAASIDDFFYILKISGNRAIETLNLQLCMAIINNIKSILFDELLELFDHKISTVLIKSEFKNKNFSELKYSCKDEPCLSYKNNPANLFLIICFNLIDESKNNLFLLFDDFKNYLSESIFNSEVFNHENIILGVINEDLVNNKIKYFHKSEVDLINHLFSEVEQLNMRYDEFLYKKIKLLFEFINPQIKASVEILNSSNYIIDSKKINSVDFMESLMNKLVEETEKLMGQWKGQMSENSFNKFVGVYSDYIAQYVEMVLILKKYNTFGIILLEKDMNKLINFLQEKVSISIREKFNRLISFVKILNFDNKEELMNHLKLYDDIKLTKIEIENIRKLKKD